MTMVAPSAPTTRPRAILRLGRLRVTIGGLRLASGLFLFAYVFCHLLNHALGNVSLAAMEGALPWVGALWWSLPGQIALYGSVAIHLALGLWALYRRRPFRFRPIEAAQMALGLAIPLMLLGHVIGTRAALALHGTSKGFAQVLYFYAVESPADGAMQAVTLVVVWLHGCFGLYLWLRLKPVFPRIAPLLLCLAVLMPTLALLGMAQGAREVARFAQDPVWRAAQLTPASTGTAAQGEALGRLKDRLIWLYLGCVGIALAGRFARHGYERRGGIVSFTYPDGHEVRVPAGTSVLEASRLHRIAHAAVCGGKGRCSTCRIRIVDHSVELPPPSAAEQAVLDRIGAEDGIRLACQLRPSGRLTVAPLMTTDRPRQQLLAQAGALGEERFVVAMFVDMRGSTRLAERRLPFDTVFVINRFLEAVGQAVAESGGSPNQFLGDGMLALFGLENGREEAARQGIAAVGRVMEAVATLNATLAPHLDEPIRYGIGLHAGTAILGEIGDRRHGGAVFPRSAIRSTSRPGFRA